MQKSVMPIFASANESSSSWFRKTLAGIEDEACRNKIDTRLYMETPEIIEINTLPKVAVLVGSSTIWLQRTLDLLDITGRMAVLAGSEPENFGDNVSGVTFNRYGTMAKTAAYLKECGRTRIAFFGVDPNSTSDLIRKHALIEVAEQLNLKFSDENDIYTIRGTLDECFERLFSSAGEYDAVICANDVKAYYFIMQAMKHGIRIPGNMYVIGFGNMLICSLCNPSITTLSLDYHEIGVQSVYAWSFHIMHPDVNAMKIIAADNLVIRESTDNKAFNHTTASLVHNPVKYESMFYRYSGILEELVQIEKCLVQCNSFDMKIIDRIVKGKNFECIAEELYTSTSTINYHAGKIYNLAQVKNRIEFTNLMTKYVSRDISSAILV